MIALHRKKPRLSQPIENPFTFRATINHISYAKQAIDLRSEADPL
jgi:hypothetical protein